MLICSIKVLTIMVRRMILTLTANVLYPLTASLWIIFANEDAMLVARRQVQAHPLHPSMSTSPITHLLVPVPPTSSLFTHAA